MDLVLDREDRCGLDEPPVIQFGRTQAPYALPKAYERRRASSAKVVSPKLREAILDLHRDDFLRRTYIRRWWTAPLD